MVNNDPGGQNGPDGAANERHPESSSITPELVREITEKVYVMLLTDLKKARERQGMGVGSRHTSGGW